MTSRRVWPYVYAIVLVVGTFGLRLLLERWAGTGGSFLLFFSAVLLMSYSWGEGPGLLAAFLSVPLASYLYVSHDHHALTEVVWWAVVFLIEAAVICLLVGRLRRATAAEQEALKGIRSSHLMLRNLTDELREAQRVAHVGSWVRDTQSNVIYWSEELYRIFGWDIHEKPPGLEALKDIYTPESMQKLSPAIERVLKRGIPYQLELQLRRPDGQLAWINARAEALRDPSGRIAGYRGVAQDVTELKELQQLREEWISVIAHDLRQPIGVISIAAGLLPALHEGEMREKEKTVIERIRMAVSTLARMVDDLLDASRMETHRLVLQRTWIDPLKLTREVVDKMSHLTSGFEVRVSQEGGLQPLFVDPTRLEQVLSNLLSNAAKYGEKGTEIRIALRQSNESIAFSVTNRGRGVTAEEIPHLFDRFTRSRASQNAGIPGLGLGLYITRGLIEAHGGQIGVESVPGETTTFRFVLPIRADLKERAA